MNPSDPLKIYFVVGEASGDALGAQLLDTFKQNGVEIDPVGLAGGQMQERGVKSLFDISDLSVMGISGVIAQLPKLLSRINTTAKDVIAKQPDVLLLIDSPEFSYRVARRVRKKSPNIKIIKYVCPTVWAWRPGRAKTIKPYIDHILALLPFEPELLKKLGGPDATFVGHPLASNMPTVKKGKKTKCSTPLKLLILPGSRRSETKRLLPVIDDTLRILSERGNELEITLPAVDNLKDEITDVVRGWKHTVNIISGEAARIKAFESADVALAASGTVTLELALYKVPMIAIYKLDAVLMAIRHIITAWTASLPNLIADYPVVPERVNEYAHPEYLARLIERLAIDGEERQIQLKGFEIIRERMEGSAKTHAIAANRILEIAGRDTH